MDSIRFADAVMMTLARLQKFHGLINTSEDEDVKGASMDAFVKASRQLVIQASGRLSSVDMKNVLTNCTTRM